MPISYHTIQSLSAVDSTPAALLLDLTLRLGLTEEMNLIAIRNPEAGSVHLCHCIGDDVAQRISSKA